MLEPVGWRQKVSEVVRNFPLPRELPELTRTIKPESALLIKLYGRLQVLIFQLTKSVEFRTGVLKTED